MAGPPLSPAAADVDFRAIVESAADVVYVLDLEGRFTYLNPRAREVFGYDASGGEALLGRSFMDFLAPEAAADAMKAIRHRTEFPLDPQTFRIALLHSDGSPIRLEVRGSALWREGRMVGRMGVCRVLEDAEGRGSATAAAVRARDLHEERLRIARGLRDAIGQVVFGVTTDRDSGEAFLADIKSATLADVARRLGLDEIDLAILRSIAAGASNREIGPEVHLSASAVKDRIRRLMDRLGAHRRAELAAHALRLGIA